MIAMRDSTVTVLDEMDHEFIRLLKCAGAPRCIADVISYLKNVDEASSQEIERGTELSYNDVVQAMQALRELDWIEEREDKGAGVGRHSKIYALKIPLEEIVRHFEERKVRESTQAREAIQRLKELASSINP